MRFADQVEPREQPSHVEELRGRGARAVDVFAGGERVARRRRVAARHVQLRDEGSAARPPWPRGGKSRFREQIEERRLERDRQRPLRANEQKTPCWRMDTADGKPEKAAAKLLHALRRRRELELEQRLGPRRGGEGHPKRVALRRPPPEEASTPPRRSVDRWATEQRSRTIGSCVSPRSSSPASRPRSVAAAMARRSSRRTDPVTALVRPATRSWCCTRAMSVTFVSSLRSRTSARFRTRASTSRSTATRQVRRWMRTTRSPDLTASHECRSARATHE